MDAPYLAGSGQLIPRAGHGGKDGCGGSANIGAQRERVGTLQTYYSNTWESRELIFERRPAWEHPAQDEYAQDLLPCTKFQTYDVLPVIKPYTAKMTAFFVITPYEFLGTRTRAFGI